MKGVEGAHEQRTFLPVIVTSMVNLDKYVEVLCEVRSDSGEAQVATCQPLDVPPALSEWRGAG